MEYRMSRRLPAVLAAVLLSLLPVAACAGTWVLANGDRLTGRLVAETATEVVVEHPQLGRLTLPRTALQPAPAPAPVAEVATAPAAPAKTKELTDDEAAGKWRRKVELGVVLQDGPKVSRDLNLRVQTEGRWAGNSIRATAAATRAEADGKVTRDREEAEVRVRRDFNRRTFAQTLTNYFSDDVRRVDLSVEQQVGGGYRVLDSRRQKASVGVGAVLQRYEREGYLDQTAVLGSAFQDYAYAWNDRVKLTQESSLQFSDRAPAIARNVAGGTLADDTPDGTYRLKLNTTLQTKMTDQVSLNLRYEYDFDRSIVEPELRADSRLTTSLVYAW
jgi:putative salt-induced outer membrane protein YdiY